MRERIIAEARGWIGTPYRHQAALRGVGCDCVGLVRGVGLAVGAWDDAGWSEFAAYSRTPNPRRMGEGMRRFLVELYGDPLPGDVAWVQWRDGLPMHLAIIAEQHGRRTMIHALSEIGRVVEHGIDDAWQSRIVSFWRFPHV